MKTGRTGLILAIVLIVASAWAATLMTSYRMGNNAGKLAVIPSVDSALALAANCINHFRTCNDALASLQEQPQ